MASEDWPPSVYGSSVATVGIWPSSLSCHRRGTTGRPGGSDLECAPMMAPLADWNPPPVGVTLLIDVSVGDTCRAPCRVARRERCQRSRRPGKRRWPRPTGVPRAGRYRGCSARWPLFTGPRASGPPAARMSVRGGSRDGQRGSDAVAVRVGCSDSRHGRHGPRASRPQASFSLVPSRGM